MRLLTFLFITFILAVSCTIQKRTFRNGYYVSWNNARNLPEKDQQPDNKFVDAISPAEEIEEEEEAQMKLVVEVSIAPEEKVETVLLSDSVSSKTNVPFSVKSSKEKESSIDESSKEFTRKKSLDLEENPPKKKLNFFALGSFGLSLVYAALLLLSISMNLSESIAAIAILFLFAAIACAVVAFIKAKRNRGKYWGTFFAVFALVIALAATIGAFAHLIAISA